MKVTAAIQLTIDLLVAAQRISQEVAQAQAAGSDTLTHDQWASIIAENSAARDRLAKVVQ